MSNLLDKVNSHILNEDYSSKINDIKTFFKTSKILVIGGAGSIGREVVKILCAYDIKQIDVVDINENGSVELIRDINCGYGFNIRPEIYVIDVFSESFKKLLSQNKYNFILNFSAMKHVRSGDNILNAIRTLQSNVMNTQFIISNSKKSKIEKLFSVSTDKASSPVNIMGASKKLMELLLQQKGGPISSSARFANVAFSDGSILDSVNKRIQKGQPIGAPSNIQRYFISHYDAARLCILSIVFSENNDIFFSKLFPDEDLINIRDLIIEIIQEQGLEPDICKTEEEAREKSKFLKLSSKKWPCIFSKSVTSGEKVYEEFYNATDTVDYTLFKNIGVIKCQPSNIDGDEVMKELTILDTNDISKQDIINFISKYLNDFVYIEKNKNLNQII
jgi:FlaA1/EpsC-like NDP-sugar epimerase